MSRPLPPSCAAHRGFPLPCAACVIAANPADVPRADSARGMRPATTTAAARARRLVAVAEAAQRGKAAR